MSEPDWDALKPLLVKGFRTNLKDPGELSTHWGRIFSSPYSAFNIAFSYDKNVVLNSMIAPSGEALDEQASRLASEIDAPGVAFETYGDGYFHYNIIADEIRTRVVGETLFDPRAEKLAGEFAAALNG